MLKLRDLRNYFKKTHPFIMKLVSYKVLAFRASCIKTYLTNDDESYNLDKGIN